MATATLADVRVPFAADPAILKAILASVDSALGMCDLRADCVGISGIPCRDPGIITGIIGVHGEASGYITVNMAERVALAAVSGLLGDRFAALNPQVADGVGEITNMIAGGIKNGLSGSAWSFRHVTVPSVVVGHNHHILYARGIHYLAATFEQQNAESIGIEDRLLQVAVSLLRS